MEKGRQQLVHVGLLCTDAQHSVQTGGRRVHARLDDLLLCVVEVADETSIDVDFSITTQTTPRSARLERKSRVLKGRGE